MEPFRGISNIIVATVLWLGLMYLTWGIALAVFAIWAFLVFSGADRRREAALEKISQTLMPSESLAVAAVQSRPFALWSRRQSIGMTDSRVIIVSRGLLGGFTMRDLQWKDLQDVELSEQVLPDLCGSSLSFAFRKGDFGSRANAQRGSQMNSSSLPTFVVGGVPSEEARSIYRDAQAHEQAWEEKRRVRAIEETRAAAGGVYVNTSPQGLPEPAKKDSGSLIQELNSLKQLLDTGVINDAEFQEMKSKIIARA